MLEAAAEQDSLGLPPPFHSSSPPSSFE
jgi:hypothetical protein